MAQTNVQTENLPILQVFVPYQGRCPKSKKGHIHIGHVQVGRGSDAVKIAFQQIFQKHNEQTDRSTVTNSREYATKISAKKTSLFNISKLN